MNTRKYKAVLEVQSFRPKYAVQKFPFRLLILLVIAPALSLGFLLWKYGVNCPSWDEWVVPGTDLVQFNLGQLTTEQLISQYNESRKFFPRLIFIYLSQFTNWNPRYGMLLSWLLSCLTTFNLYYLSKHTLKAPLKQTLACLILASMLIFSPTQWENWLWGLQMITFVPIAAITTAFVIIFAANPIIIKLLSSAALATIATFSFANGIISWVVIFPTLYIAIHTAAQSNPSNRRSLMWVTAGWLLFFSLNVAVYFHDYHRPAAHPSFVEALLQPINSIAYYLAFIGSPLGIYQLTLSQILGLVILATCLLIAVIYWYLRKINQNKELLAHLIPWLSILGYALISGGITTVGRVGFGVSQSLAPRYITFSTYGIVALIYLLAIVAREINHCPNFFGDNYRRIINSTIKVLLIAFLIIFPFNFNHGVQASSVAYRDRLFGKSCLTLINVVPNQACIERFIYPDFSFLLERANQLNKIGLLQPSLISSDRLQDFSQNNLPQISYGSFDSLTLGEDNSYTVSGWAVLPLYNTPAHAVILAYQTADGVDHPLAIVKPELAREDVWRALGKKQYRPSGWSQTFPQHLIPDHAVAVSAWSFDAKLARAYKIKSISLNDPP